MIELALTIWIVGSVVLVILAFLGAHDYSLSEIIWWPIASLIRAVRGK